jgi:ubiquinone/menaquinone biosynthesis C-methylase UbiE
MTTVISAATLAATPPLAHSEEYFGAYRNFWWHTDFLALMAERLQTRQLRHMLDVGCGQCHWSRLWLAHLAAQAEITALDRDPRWAAGDVRLQAHFAAQGARLRFVQGDAARLPFADASFDMVTCQTLLIHVADPSRVLSEMRRVLRPGGLLLCSEPSNLANAAMANALTVQSDSAAQLDAFRYRLLCEEAKRLAGEGDSSLGDKLAWLLQACGFQSIQSYLSDKATPLLPPYVGQEAQANLNEVQAMAEPSRALIWQAHVARWAAALPDPAERQFLLDYAASAVQAATQIVELVAAGQYWDSGAALMYLVAGRR